MNDLNILRHEVFRYMGHKGAADSALWEDVNTAISIINDTAKPKYTYRFFDYTVTKEGILMSDSSVLLPGADIVKHLKRARKAALLAVTLGSETDKAIAYQMTLNPSLGLAVDSAATAAVESISRSACNQMIKELDMDVTLYSRRFSCGYGDLPLEIQPKLLSVLDAGRKIGLYSTDNFLLTPQKSVTAIVGIFEDTKVDASAYFCKICDRADGCPYKIQY